MLAQYFDKSGRRLRRAEALDAAGCLRDGVIARTPMIARDAAARFSDARAHWDAERDALLITDAALGGTEGSKPGYRISDSAINITDRAAAYSDYTHDLENAWRSPLTGEPSVRDAKKITRRDPGGRLEGTWEEEDDDVCPACGGDGEINGQTCEACGGTGELNDEFEDNCARETRTDSDRTKTVDQLRAAHRQTMDRVYSERDHDLQNAWRNNK